MKLLGKYKDEELIAVYTTIKSAADENNVSAPAISMSMRHYGKCRNFVWKWIDVNADVIYKAIKNNL